MENWVQTVIIAFLSGGGCSLILYLIQRHDNKKDKEDDKLKLIMDALRGLAHDRIMELGMRYLKRGSITKNEYDNLYNSLWLPYKDLKGNGTAKKMMEDIKELPLVDEIKMNEGDK